MGFRSIVQMMITDCVSQRQQYYKMASLVDEDTASDFNDIGHKMITHLKTFNFFVYYEEGQLGEGPGGMNLEKLSFKLKEDKGSSAEKYGDNNKNVQLSFCSIENEIEVSNSLHHLKVCAQEFKTRLIFYTSEAAMLHFLIRAKILAINIDTIPICIYTNAIHPDFANFLGWGAPSTPLLNFLSLPSAERQIRNWVDSPTEKVDIWSVDIKVAQEGGLIEKINRAQFDPDLSSEKLHRDYFVSSMSVGYHPQLLIDYEKRKKKNSNFLNRFIYSFQGFKKFCCVGNSDMREATGVVKIDFEDDYGSHEILKELRDHEEDDLHEKKPKRKNQRKILSIALSNIDYFLGEKLKSSFQSRMNDKRLELLAYQSIKDCYKISTVSGKIRFSFEQEHPVYLQVNDSCYRLTRPVCLQVECHGKAKVVINKDTLSC